MEQGIMSREDPEALKYLFDIFTPKEGFYWFVESNESRKWITSYFPNNANAHKEVHLTIIPTEAMRFETQISAESYIIYNHLMQNFKPTEHEFINP